MYYICDRTGKIKYSQNKSEDDKMEKLIREGKEIVVPFDKYVNVGGGDKYSLSETIKKLNTNKHDRIRCPY